MLTRFILLFVLLNLFTHPAGAQKTEMTIEQAVEQVLDSDPRIASWKSDIEVYRGERITAETLPNPELSYEREDLSGKSSSEGEEILTVEYPFNVFWQRSPLIKEAEARINFAENVFSHSRIALTFEVRKAYLAYHLATMDTMTMNSSVNALIKIMRDIHIRRNEGDLAGFDYDRIALEFDRVRSDADLLELEYQTALKELIVLLGTVASEPPNTILPEPSIDTTFSREQALRTALEHREDLMAAEVTVIAEEFKRKFLSREAWPKVTVGVGYKRDFDDLRGPVSRIGLSIPIVDRKQGAKLSAKARHRSAELNIEDIRRTIHRETEQAYDRLEKYKNLYERQQTGILIQSSRLLETALVTYGEGELNVTELIDVIRAHIEAGLRSNRIHFNYLLSIYELDYVTAGLFVSSAITTNK